MQGTSYVIFCLECCPTYLKEAKRSVVIHHDQATHQMNGVRTLMIEHSVFSIMAGLILEILFMLFSIYKTV